MFHFSQPQSPLKDAITHAYRLDEKTAVQKLVGTLDFTQTQKDGITDLARPDDKHG